MATNSIKRLGSKAKIYVVTFCRNGELGDTAGTYNMRKAKSWQRYFIGKGWTKVRIIENKANLWLDEILENEKKSVQPVQLSLNF